MHHPLIFQFKNFAQGDLGIRKMLQDWLNVESVIFNSDWTLKSNDYVYVSEFQFS